MSLKLKARDVFVNAKAVEKLGQNRRVWVNLVGFDSVFFIFAIS